MSSPVTTADRPAARPTRGLRTAIPVRPTHIPPAIQAPLAGIRRPAGTATPGRRACGTATPARPPDPRPTRQRQARAGITQRPAAGMATPQARLTAPTRVPPGPIRAAHARALAGAAAPRPARSSLGSPSPSPRSRGTPTRPGLRPEPRAGAATAAPRPRPRRHRPGWATRTAVTWTRPRPHPPPRHRARLRPPQRRPPGHWQQLSGLHHRPDRGLLRPVPARPGVPAGSPQPVAGGRADQGTTWYPAPPPAAATPQPPASAYPYQPDPAYPAAAEYGTQPGQAGYPGTPPRGPG